MSLYSGLHNTNISNWSFFRGYPTADIWCKSILHLCQINSSTARAFFFICLFLFQEMRKWKFNDTIQAIRVLNSFWIWSEVWFKKYCYCYCYCYCFFLFFCYCYCYCYCYCFIRWQVLMQTIVLDLWCLCLD